MINTSSFYCRFGAIKVLFSPFCRLGSGSEEGKSFCLKFLIELVEITPRQYLCWAMEQDSQLMSTSRLQDSTETLLPTLWNLITCSLVLVNAFSLPRPAWLVSWKWRHIVAREEGEGSAIVCLPALCHACRNVEYLWVCGNWWWFKTVAQCLVLALSCSCRSWHTI